MSRIIYRVKAVQKLRASAQEFAPFKPLLLGLLRVRHV
jgi:hypothetical protein